METRLLTATEITKLEAGSLVIAVFEKDSRRYRAKVEKIVTHNDGKKSFKVRYIDYGNSDEVEASQLYTWEPLLEAVPSQAICCRLKDLKVFVAPILPGTKMAEHFTNSMKHISPLKMRVQEILYSREHILRGKRISTELVVNLECHSSGQNILNKLTEYSVFNEVMNVEKIFTSGGPTLNLDIIGVDQTVPAVSVPPPPDHLKHCPLSRDNLIEFSLPTDPALAFSVDKVSKWLPCLDRGLEDDSVSGDQVTIEEDKVFKKPKKPLPKEPEFGKSAAAKRKLISNAKKVCGSGESDRATGISKTDDGSLFPSQDIRKFKEVVTCPASGLDIRKDEDLVKEESTKVIEGDNNPSEQIISTNKILDMEEGITNDGPPLTQWKFQDIEVSLKVFLAPSGAQEMQMFVRPSGPSFSRALNLHLYGSGLSWVSLGSL